jgi:NTE family protein
VTQEQPAQEHRTRIAIACQGGGSQCAFVAGVLKGLFARGVHDHFEIVGLSGTSGGALTAAQAWMGLLERAHGDRTPVEDRVVGLWNDLTAQSPREILLDASLVQIQRLVERGLLPSVASSPSSLLFRMMTGATAQVVGRPEFTDLRALVLKHMDFAAIPSLLDEHSPTLLVGACDVLQGDFKVFTSVKGEISVDSLLASAAIPNLFPAVEVDGHSYWDGIFSSNPPITAFLREPMMGRGHVPEEIWIVQVNRWEHDKVPERPSDIVDRRNALAGNLSMQHELQVVSMVNMLLAEGALTDSFRARFGFDTTRAITVRMIRMSPELVEDLDYPSKLSRQPAHIARLIADGEAQADRFLTTLLETDVPASVIVTGDSVAVH